MLRRRSPFEGTADDRLQVSGVPCLAAFVRIDARLAARPGIALTGNSYRGVAVNNCAKEAKELALRLAP